MADARAWTQDETIAVINETAKTHGDNFRLKFSRRSTGQALPMPFATFDEASVIHIANLETWFPALLAGGGGTFDIAVIHPNEPTRVIGGAIRFVVNGNPSDPDFTPMGAVDWAGPKKLLFPSGVATKNGRPEFQLSGGIRREETPAPTATPPSATSRVTGQAADLLALEDSISRRQRDLDRREAEIREAQMKAEFDLKLERIQAAQQAAPQKNMLVELLPVVAPIVQGLLSSMEAGRKETRDLMLKVLEKQNAGIDPTVQVLLEQMKLMAKPDDGNAKMILQMSEAMQSMTNMSMQLIHTAAELQGPPEPTEPTAVKVMREVAKAAQSIMSAPAMVAAQAAKQAQARAAAMEQKRQIAAQAAQTQTPPNTVELVENAIKNFKPVDRVAQAIVQLIKSDDPNFTKELEAAGGTLEELVRRRLGGWALAETANYQYLEQLWGEFERQAEEAGIFVDEELEGEEQQAAPETEEHDDEDREVGVEESGLEDLGGPPANARVPASA